MGYVLSINGIGFGFSFVLLSIAWLVYLKTDNAAIIDVFWGPSLVIYAYLNLNAFGQLGDKEILVLALVTLWAFRLSNFLFFYRVYKKEEEGRYRKLRELWKTNIPLKFFLFFQSQNLFNFFLAFTFAGISLSEMQVGLVSYLGTALVLLGILGETVSDFQLERFKKMKDKPGRVCRIGLWNYSRHPNYFFESIVWLGFATFAFDSGLRVVALALVGPALILFTLFKVTGIPATEAQALRSKGEEYEKYQKEVSVFIPWFQKKN